MNRLWSRVGVRATSVGLLAAGLAGGLYLGQDREVQQRSAEAQLVVQVDYDDMQLLKQRQSEHAAARSWQRQAAGVAAEKAATEAKAAASKAHALETKAIAKKAADKAAADKAKAAESSPSSGTGSGSGSGSGSTSSGPDAYNGPIPESCNDYDGSRAIGCSLMIDAGFEIDQFPCMDKLFKKESGWNYKATNDSSGAYGIPQALPGSKMASVAGDWKTNPATQIKWGLRYIEGRYDTPCGAWSHSQNTGWY